MTSYYDRLGVGVDADPEEVRRAYHRRAQQLHPDRHPGSEEAMKALNEAWYTLRDPDARRRYDRALGLLPPDRSAESSWDGDWPDDDPLESRSPARPRKVWLVVAAGLVVAMLASAVAWFADPDASQDWSGASIADLRLRALNAGMTAPQANCFVEAVTSRFDPSEEIPDAAIRYLSDACR